jgi:ribosomal protein S18 acetylase RimI-like enzyme
MNAGDMTPGSRRMTGILDIRVLGPDDAPAYRDLRIEASDDPAFASNPQLEAAMPLELLRKVLIASAQGQILGAFDDGMLLGMVGLGRSEATHACTLFGLYVTGCARRHGVGRALVRALLDRARTYADVTSVELSVDSSNDVALSLYKNEGFMVEENRRDSAVVMRLCM